MSKLEKPRSITENEAKSKKWDEITAGRSFQKSDIPTLALLCQWHLVVEQCIADMDEHGNKLTYENSMRDIKAYPQLEIMKKASTEIRQLNKQLGIADTADDATEATSGASIIQFAAKRQERRARAAN